MQARCRGLSRGDSKIQIHPQAVAVAGIAMGMQSLCYSIRCRFRCDARTDFAACIKIAERALSRIGHGDPAAINPWRNQDAVAAARGWRLKFKITVHVMQRTQNRTGYRLLLLFEQ